jgi:hypothetical protein
VHDQHQQFSPDDHNPSEYQDLQLEGGCDELVIFDKTNMNDADDHQQQQQQQQQLPLTTEEGGLQLEIQVETTQQQSPQQPQLQSQQQQVLLHEHVHLQRSSYDDCSENNDDQLQQLMVEDPLRCITVINH